MCLSFSPFTITESESETFLLHHKSYMEFDLQNPLALNTHDHLHRDDDAVSSLFLTESEHAPSPSYFHALKSRDFDISVRREAVTLISQFSCTLDPVVSFLAINYVDRFLANQGILQPKPWTLRLLAMSCISLASKMMRTEYSASANIQALLEGNGGGIIFETQTIQRMEGLILGALQWRMRSITPFSFTTFFVTLIRPKDPPMEQALKERTAEIIFKSQREIKLLEFKPSIVAASALLCASHELFPFQYPSFLEAISDCSYVNKERMVECYNVIQDVLGMEEYETLMNEVSSSGTPVNVLDHHFLSLESEETNGITLVAASASTMRQDHKDLKRRKINNQTVHVSRITHC